ncbi:DUF58 domain-containing protein [Dichotomicrobium thermohalophilum]|uniref:Uncharacterized protein DUF58 n=1 Tax=Dichotomicrobium thermohalophilum TaxID=933063 RepID=A0A397PG49_9HYPH|nr:DUF58 domain-containing protein [Dichotomicrobium thermohalophilum]RIA47433.1 uncharacterized protein DUF58 [Dichotomicrobium thermohalophilum]
MPQHFPAPAPQDLENTAHALATRLPALLIEANRAAHTVAHGIHGRRRAGPGETFWQFRHYESTDTATSIDWRRSAGSDHLFVREREWEAAHTVWLWLDLSDSMGFRSHLAAQTKAERAIVLGFAMAELLIQGGERVGLLGLTPPSTSRQGVHRMAVALTKQLRSGSTMPSLPPSARISRYANCMVFSDFLDPIEDIQNSLQRIADQNARGHLVQVLDPAEETLPYDGRVEFIASETGERITAERASELREQYQTRLHAHRAEVESFARKLQWPFLCHHTDRPAEETLLALHTRMAGLDKHYRAKPVRPATEADLSENAGG